MRTSRQLPLFLMVLSAFVILQYTSHSSSVPTRAQDCTQQAEGDATCDGRIDMIDFEVFRKELSGELATHTADFDASGTVSIADFEIWRRGYFNQSVVTPTTPPLSPTGVSLTPTTAVPSATLSPTKTAGCSYPSQILDLTNWYISLPVGSSKPTDVFQPALATYMMSPYFMVNSSCDGVQFRAHTSSPVTTSNSSYPRSELREMTNSGLDKAAWTNTKGTHTMIIDEAITAVPKGKKHVVAGQIHDASDDVIVIRLEYPKLFVDINGIMGPTLDATYTLGKRFNVKFVAADGKIQIFYNNAGSPAYTLTKSITNSYFKAGAYTQSNCARETEYGSTCAADNYGEVIIYRLSVTHL